MTGLLGRLEALLDGFLTLGVTPGAEEITDGVDLQHMLKRQGDVVSHHFVERQTQNWIARHSLHPSMNEGPILSRLSHKPVRSHAGVRPPNDFCPMALTVHRQNRTSTFL